MFKISIFLMLFGLVSCFKYKAPGNKISGGDMNNPMSSGDYININPRTNTEGLQLISVTPFSTQTSKLAELPVPASWPDFNAEELKDSFCFLAKNNNCNNVYDNVSFDSLNDSDRLVKLFKDGKLAQTYKTNRTLDVLEFEKSNGQKVSISQTNHGQWIILVEDQMLLWNISEATLCFQNDCISSGL